MKFRNIYVFCMVLLVFIVSGKVQAANLNPLPDTGQTNCYAVDGSEISCPTEGQPLHGQDAQYQNAEPSYTSQSFNGEMIVVDNNTILEWQQDTADTNGDGSITGAAHPAGDTMTWQDSIDYCEGLDFADSSNWRLPDFTELDTIVDYGRENLAINPVFQAVQSGYWSETTHANDTVNAWNIRFSNGIDKVDSKNDVWYVRCVRGTHTSLGPYTDQSDTVSDQATGLTWQKQTADSDDNGTIDSEDMLNWQEALAWCEGQISFNYSDWRLPNVRELRSLVDRSTSSPSIDSVFQCESDNYWSSTTAIDLPHIAAPVSFDYGDHSGSTKTKLYYVRCVRGGLSESSSSFPWIMFLPAIL